MRATLPIRQIHLDFHTSPHIPDVGSDFDPDDFAATLQRAHVDSITLFAKCHHGYSYYPTEIGTPHPHLQSPDLLGEMIESCHAVGIRTPIYTTVVWDELAWETHPEWRMVTPEGKYAGVVDTPLQPGWKNLCMNTAYADYVIAQIEEIVDRYDGDGLFIDIVRYSVGAGSGPCVCATCLAQMQAEGVDPMDEDERWQFALRVERRFMQRVTRAIQAKDPEQSIFFNSRLRMTWDPDQGNRPEQDLFTHLEIESLPGGFWGYDHFPMYVRYFETYDMPLLAMTGRFHTTWGDFGGLRNQAALAFECFQALAHGAAISIGDQLPPRGRLDAAVYDRIGSVYAQVAQREAWSRNSQALPDIGVVTANAVPHHVGAQIHESDRGALHVLEQLHHQFAFLDAGADFSPYRVIVLPDAVPVSEAMAARLRSYLDRGGALLMTGVSGLDQARGEFVLAEEMGIQYRGAAAYAPDYLLLGDALHQGVESMPPVCQLPRTEIVASNAQVLAHSGKPYFNRTWAHFCSHQYTPMEAPTGSPVIVQNGNVIYCAHPLFREYAESARRVHRQVLANCLQRLLPQTRIGRTNLPSTAIVTARAQQDTLILHLLHYIHQRRGKTLDVIEDVIPLHDVEISVRTEQKPADVRVVPEDVSLDWTWEAPYAHIHVPRVNGYQQVAIFDAVSAPST